MNAAMTYTFFSTCAKSLEPLLASELEQFSADDIRPTVAGVYFTGSLKTAYRVTMYSRLANRVIVTLSEAPVSDADTLYQAAQAINWLEHMAPGARFAVSAAGTTPSLRHTRFVAQRVKDAIVDQFTEARLTRPEVETQNPPLRVHAVLKKGRVLLGIELTRSSLHRRGYRLEQGEAPMKETLAAAILIRAGWPELSRQPGVRIFDPMCGAGTLLIEAMLMAMDVAPGLIRVGGLSTWLLQDHQMESEIRAEAEARREAGREWDGQAFGSDQDLRVIGMARRNAERAEVWDQIEFSADAIDEIPEDFKAELVVTNPPYAQRLGEEEEVMALYNRLGEIIQRAALGNRAAVFTARPEWGKLLGLHSHKQYAMFNGALPARLLLFDVNENSIYKQQRNAADQGKVVAAQALDEQGQMFYNRLRKNIRNIGKWARQQKISCYRLYDADIPEFAFALDIYTDIKGKVSVHLQEYAPPATVNAADAAIRRRQALLATEQALELPAEQISLKTREKQKGSSQYQAQEQGGEDFIVDEYGAQLYVNLHQYLDTGLFLDHRPLRRLVRKLSKDKSVLNLFCYTGSVTVQAALGGASRTVSVDLSKKYLYWAGRNLALNNLSLKQHQLVEADCQQWLKGCKDRFDIIFLDPPTFSNSKRTEQDLDIQRDHVSLIETCMGLLQEGGLLIFSNNMRKFRLDSQVSETWDVEDYSKPSIDKDFQRNPKIHRAWLIRSPSPVSSSASKRSSL
jgi:23S rRNA (guanine2445-N2)-methyltransferase / 23S rRNA (guanine2069-N7)-methyltransferase